MKIGVLSDTHDQIEMIKKAVNFFNEQQVDLVIHCGDWVAPFTLQYYASLKAPVRGVFGNNDGDKFRHLQYKQKFNLNILVEDRFLELEVDQKKIAVFHGDYEALVDALVLSKKYDLVLHGHTHQKINEHKGKTLSLNPGSLLVETSPTIFGASVAIYNTHTHSATHHELDKWN